MIERESWYREAQAPDLLTFLRTQLLEMVKSGKKAVTSSTMGWIAAILASFVGISLVLRKSAKDFEKGKRYHDTKLGRMYEFSLCILWGIQPPWVERCWRGYCHYQDLGGPKKSYAWHFKGDMAQAWRILRGTEKWGPDPDDLVFVEIEKTEG